MLKATNLFLALAAISVSLFATNAHASSSEKACLAKMAYIEARGLGSQGIKDVVDVMFNRMNHPKFPNTVCGNIAKKGQYPWYKSKFVVKEHSLYKEIRAVTAAYYDSYKLNKWRDGTRGAIFFNSDRRRPHPRAKMLFVRNKHYFYKL